jgi:GMP synthase (glutamine-hydrolysing)
MKMLVITHASFEKPGSIQDWAERNNYQITEVKPYAGEKLPPIDNFDFLIVMGGPQSPLSMDESPYLRDEIETIKDAVKLNKRIVGVCLGAQLIGEALGAKTEQSPNREIGSYTLELLEDAKNDPVFSQFPQYFDVMHWHSDMPGIPEGAKLIAKSEGCPRQIFTYGDRIYGFQCHFELTKELVSTMIDNCPNDLKAGRYVMSKEELKNIDFIEINRKMDAVLNHLAGV